jgi:hypothetical protein
MTQKNRTKRTAQVFHLDASDGVWKTCNAKGERGQVLRTVKDRNGNKRAIVAQGCGMGGNRLTLAQIAATGGGLVDTRGDGLRRVSEVLEGVFWTEVNEPNDDARRRYYFSNDGSRPSRKDLEDWRKKIQKASE